jgi:hypothetical protein
MHSGLGLKFESKLKPVMHCPAFIIKTKTAMVSPLRLAVIRLQVLSNYSTISLANCFPGNGARNACWHSLIYRQERLVGSSYAHKDGIPQAHRITRCSISPWCEPGYRIYILREALWLKNIEE